VTALNFHISDDEICLVVDSLAISPQDGEPLVLLTKFIVLPHLGITATGTGHGQFLAEWFARVRDGILAKDIDRVDQYTPSMLRTLAADHDLDVNSATVYHFGFSPRNNRFVAYVYRSTSGFTSERVDSGLGIKPQVEPPEGDVTYPAAFVEIMERQRNADLQRPPAERIGIGGEIHCVHMQRSGFSVFTLHRFSSYDREYDAACQRL